ncbi:endonuclease/exonuclease/phosphatase family protein [Pontibacter sp. SGAir0037]|uniref:endonuclease/exonuclease/phosphatase family protein n=1 Tax=Pontibacter sp. SGAir0037 TaxID=2571030 RepID=UPI0010CCF133|nr:endonuclease/exonuclease/phosphatase family protein [Pontibacter sp. SGAir0037]QCR21157.1 endonuclease [Pontibacter sp. SGAir0037]
MSKIFVVLSVVLMVILSGFKVAGQQLRVATYNIRYDNPGDEGNLWKQRLPVIENLIQFHDFDIFGAQEVLANQLQDLAKSLPAYGYIGVGRDDGKAAGEFSPIFYKKDKFKLLKQGTFWLSEVTDRPNKGWDAALPRVCTWGQFQDVKSGLTFFLFNTHFDHRGVKARSESAKLILEKIKTMAGTSPVILTGDFNIDQNNEGYKLLQNSDLLEDAYEITPVRYASTGTFNGFNANTKTESRIDHIFVSNKFKVKRYGILTDSYRGEAKPGQEAKREDSGNFPNEVALHKYEAKMPSDHFPVMVELSF